MKDIIEMAREAGFECDRDGHIFADDPDGVCDEELERFAHLVRAALAEQPAEQEPVAWAMPRNDGVYIDVITPEEHARCEGEYTVPLYAAPPQTIPSSGESHEDSLKSRDEALRIADALEATHPAVWTYGKEAAAELRRLHDELVKVKQIILNDEALLQQALEALTVATLGSLTGKWKRGEELITAIKERLK